MKDKSKAITTEELWSRLFSSSTIDSYFGKDTDECALPAFCEYITELCKARNEKAEQVIKRSDLDSSFGHRLFSGARRPSRDTVMQLAFGFGMDVDGAQQLLKVARASALHPKVKRDAVIAFCLHNSKTLVETQQLLYDNGLPILGGAGNER